MGLQICGKCGRFHYVPGDCPQPKLVTKEGGPSLLAGQVVGRNADAGSIPAVTSAPKRGRPRTGFDKKQYDRDRMKQRRERERAAREGR